MTKQEEIKRFSKLANEPDSYLALLLGGFEEQFAEMVKNDEVYSISDMINIRDKEISNLTEELKRVRVANAELKKNIQKYLQLILNAEYNIIAIRYFVNDINKLLEEL